MNFKEEIVRKTEAYIKLSSEKLPYNTHHLDHIYRVRKNCLNIAQKVKCNTLILEISALLHDIGRFYELDKDNHELISSELARKFLIKHGLTQAVTEKICYAIESHRFRRQITPETIEAKILQDADKIDALGAIGIIRVIAHPTKQMLYDLNNPKTSFDDRNDNFRINHFYNKILKLPQLLHTQPAKKMAQARIKFLKQFLDQLKSEIS